MSGAGQRWLDEVLEPALADDRLHERGAADELRGGLRALAACGLLDPTTAANAEQRLELARRAAFDRARTRTAPPGASAAAPRSTLEDVLPVAVPVADVADVTLVLVSVERWTTSVQVRLAGLPSGVTDGRDAAHEEAVAAWAARRRVTGAATRAPSPPRNALVRAPLLLGDDLGTAYRSEEGSASGRNGVWRLERTFEPAVPAGAGRLRVAVADDDGREVGAVEVDLSR